MATPAKLVRTAALEAMRASATLPVPVFRQFPDDLDVPFIRMLRGEWEREEIGKGYYQYTVTLPLQVVQVLQEGAEEDLDDLEDALDTLLLTDFVIDGYGVITQYLVRGLSEEDIDEETEAIIDMTSYELVVILT